MKIRFSHFLASLSACASLSAQAALPTLRVSDNKRFLQTTDGKPFFWLGDTAWELFHRTTREQAIQYLNDRAAKGFTVVQAVALAELDGINDPSAYGHFPLIAQDPTRPDIKDGPENDYWDHVDFIIEQANARGIYIGLLPSWGDKWNKKWGIGPEIFTPENAATYGEWIGKRYRDRGVIWINGGDRAIENETHRAIVEALAGGIRRGDLGKNLITFHPVGGTGSAQEFHNAPWLDFNMRQNGHTAQFNEGYQNTRVDYDRTPTKPVLDAEPIYEDHPISFAADKNGHSVSADVRRPLYWNLFSGAFGHTYGHHSVWQFWTADKAPINNPLMLWPDAIKQPGAVQMGYGRRLIESRPFLDRIPDDSIIVTDRVATSVPGSGRYRFCATRDQAGSYAMVYVPAGRAFAVRMNVITGPLVKAWWFDPRAGKSEAIGSFKNDAEQTFTPPQQGESLDWILVLDDEAKGYPAPGQL